MGPVRVAMGPVRVAMGQTQGWHVPAGRPRGTGVRARCAEPVCVLVGGWVGTGRVSVEGGGGGGLAAVQLGIWDRFVC